jgi:protein required for attachment to host cells
LLLRGELALVAKNKREKIGNFLLPNAPTYIVVGDSAGARIFLAESRFGDWSEIATLSNPDAALQERERGTDRPGRVFDSFGKGRHAMAPAETGRQHEIRRFAHHVADNLNKARADGSYQHLVVIAEPTFLGCLRKELSAAASKSVSCEMPLNATDRDVNKLRSLFAAEQ